MPMNPIPPKIPPTVASNTDAREALVPVRARMLGNQIVGLVDHDGNDLGLPVTALPSAQGVVKLAAGELEFAATSALTTYASSRGAAEMDGNGEYANGGITGFYVQPAADTTFNVAQFRLWCADVTDVEWRVWVRSSQVAFALTTTPTQRGEILAGSFPTVNSIFTLLLPTPVVVPAGQHLFVLFRAKNGGKIKCRRWSYDPTAGRVGFPLSLSSTWDQTIGNADADLGYGQVSPRLLYSSKLAGDDVAYSATASGLQARTVQAALDELAIVNATIPPFIYGVESRECNVYIENLHFGDASEYFHDVTTTSNLGVQQEERWTWIPTAPLGAGTFAVTINDKRTGNTLKTLTAQLRAAAASAGTGLTKTAIVIGDSLVGAGTITQTLVDVAAADAMSLTLLGTRGTGANKHEGRGGWTIANYTSNFSDGTYGANPFWIGGAVNFPQYLTANSIAVPDWVFIGLGINDIAGATTDNAAYDTIDVALGKLDVLIASAKAAGASVKVGLLIPTPSSVSQDSFGANYGPGLNKYRFKRNILIWAKQLIGKYAAQEANRIYLVPSNVALDTVNNMVVAAATPVNSRNAAVTVARQGNGVHPATSGYQQIADAVWAFLKFYA